MPLSLVSVHDRYPVPHVQVFAARLAGASVFSKVDPISGYQLFVYLDDVCKPQLSLPLVYNCGSSCRWHSVYTMLVKIAGQNNKIHQHFKAPIVNIPVFPGSFSCIHLDLMWTFTFLLTRVDRTTHWPDALPLSPLPLLYPVPGLSGPSGLPRKSLVTEPPVSFCSLIDISFSLFV